MKQETKEKVNYWKRSFLSGLGVLLPIIASVALIVWFWKTVQSLISPITSLVVGFFGDTLSLRTL